jgi:hypothetical protein
VLGSVLGRKKKKKKPTWIAKILEVIDNGTSFRVQWAWAPTDMDLKSENYRKNEIFMTFDEHNRQIIHKDSLMGEADVKEACEGIANTGTHWWRRFYTEEKLSPEFHDPSSGRDEDRVSSFANLVTADGQTLQDLYGEKAAFFFPSAQTSTDQQRAAELRSIRNLGGDEASALDQQNDHDVSAPDSIENDEGIPSHSPDTVPNSTPEFLGHKQAELSHFSQVIIALEDTLDGLLPLRMDISEEIWKCSRALTSMRRCFARMSGYKSDMDRRMLNETMMDMVDMLLALGQRPSITQQEASRIAQVLDSHSCIATISMDSMTPEILTRLCNTALEMVTTLETETNNSDEGKVLWTLRVSLKWVRKCAECLGNTALVTCLDHIKRFKQRQFVSVPSPLENNVITTIISTVYRAIIRMCWERSLLTCHGTIGCTIGPSTRERELGNPIVVVNDESTCQRIWKCYNCKMQWEKAIEWAEHLRDRRSYAAVKKKEEEEEEEEEELILKFCQIGRQSCPRQRDLIDVAVNSANMTTHIPLESSTKAEEQNCRVVHGAVAKVGGEGLLCTPRTTGAKILQASGSVSLFSGTNESELGASDNLIIMDSDDYEQPAAPQMPQIPNSKSSPVQSAIGTGGWSTTPMTPARNTKSTKVASAFNEPVDWNTLNTPTYPQVLTSPMIHRDSSDAYDLDQPHNTAQGSDCRRDCSQLRDSIAAPTIFPDIESITTPFPLESRHSRDCVKIGRMSTN